MDATGVGGFISLFLGGAMLYRAFAETKVGEINDKMFAVELICGIALIYVGFKVLL